MVQDEKENSTMIRESEKKSKKYIRGGMLERDKERENERERERESERGREKERERERWR